MARLTLCLLAVLAFSAANPVVVTFVNEIQVAPDSLERIEIHPHNWMPGLPIDLSGWQVVTATGIATVNDGVLIPHESSYVVLDRSNMTGTFSLGDEQDSITFLNSGGYVEWSIIYPPDRTYWDPDQFWRPPAGMSSSIYYAVYYQWPDPIECFGCYLDATPTFGTENDDTLGGIRGRVLDNHGHPLRCCWLLFESEYGGSCAYCDSTGRYLMRPLGPAAFAVSAHGDSSWLPAIYPESVRVEPNQMRDSIDLTIYPVGLTEGGVRPQPRASWLRWLPDERSLLVQSPAAAQVSVFDGLGRVRLERTLPAGVNTVSMRGMEPGVYVARSSSPGQPGWSRKLVLF